MALLSHTTGGQATTVADGTCSIFGEGSQQIRRIAVSSVLGTLNTSVVTRTDGVPTELSEMSVELSGAQFLTTRVERRATSFETHIQFGAAFSGIRNEIVRSDGSTMSGVIDGRQFTFSETSGLVFADGHPPPSVSVDPSLLQSLGTLITAGDNTLATCPIEPTPYSSHVGGTGGGVPPILGPCFQCEVDCALKYQECMALTCPPSPNGGPLQCLPAAFCANQYNKFCIPRCTGGCDKCCGAGQTCNADLDKCVTPPPPPAPPNFVFFDNQWPVSQHTVQQNFATLAYDPVSLGTVNLLPLNSAQNITVEFLPTGNPPIAQDAVYLFSRDPREYHDTLASILNDPDQWRTQTSACDDPGAIGVPYPQLSFEGPSRQIVGPFYTNEFFAYCDGTPQGPGAYPFNEGSIKSAYIYNRGACSAPVDYYPIVTAIQDGLWSGFSTAATRYGCADAEQFWSFASSYLSHSSPANPDSSPTGGLIFNAYFDAHINPCCFFSDTNLRFNVGYQFGLNNGILAATPTINATDFNGTGSGSAGTSMHASLTNTLPKAISDAAAGNDMSATTGQFFDNPLIVNDCDQVDGENVPAPYDASSCFAAVKFVVDGVTNARDNGLMASLGFARPSDDAQRLLATVTAQDDRGNLVNWRCKQRPPAATSTDYRYRCEYILRASRLNALPGGVELVWFDNLEDPNGTVLPLWVALKQNAGPGVPQFQQGIDKLCVPRTSTTGFWKDSFVVSNVGDRTAPGEGSSQCDAEILAGFLGSLTFLGTISNVVNGP
jgi:hypothetical protein